MNSVSDPTTASQHEVATAVRQPVRVVRHVGSMTSCPTLHRYTAQLDAEWEQLRRRPRHIAHARGWIASVSDGPLRHALDALTDLQQLIAITDGPTSSDPTCAGADPDRALVELIELARTDQLAGRIVIQRLLPGLVARGARYRSRRDGIDPAEIAVAAGWIAIHRYDTAARPRSVAASLISDATFAAFRQPLRKRSASEQSVPTERFGLRPAAVVEPTAFERLGAVVRAARINGVPARDLALIRELVQTGSPNIVAARRGVTPRTIRNHRDRAAAHIREAIRCDTMLGDAVVAA